MTPSGIRSKFLFVISVLYKTEWLWELEIIIKYTWKFFNKGWIKLGTWSHKMNSIDTFNLSPIYEDKKQEIILSYQGL